MREITDLDELKKIELDMLKEIHAVFNKNKLDYYLAYGTLLGAVRHKGFIPWDDDIDIMMPRKDYEILVANFEKLFKDSNLKLACYNGSVYYPRPFAKIIDDRTKLIETNYDDGNEIGVFIDVFVIDGLPNNKIIRFIHEEKINFYRKIAFAAVYKESLCSNWLSKVIVKYAHKINKEKIFKKIEKLCKKYDYNDSKIVGNCLENENSIIEKKLLDKTETDFEDMKAYIPIGFDQILKRRYGNYMELPPEKDRVPHHISNVYWR